MEKDNLIFKIINKKGIATLACIISGCLTALAYQFDFLWWLCLISLIPFCMVMLVKKQSAKGFFYCTLLTVGVYHCACLPWLMQIAQVIAPSVGDIAAGIIMVGAILTIAMLMGSLYALAFLLFSRLRKGKFSDIFFIAVLYVSGELFVSLLGELAFPWARLANVAVPCLPFVQSAALGGSLFVSLIIMLINASLAFFAVMLAKKETGRAFLSLAACAILLASNLIYGSVAIACAPKGEDVDILIVQGNYPSNDKWLTTSDKMLARYLELSEQGITENTDLVVWPETAIPTDIDRFTNYSSQITDFAKKHNVTVVVGYIKETADGTFNAMRVYRPDTEVDNDEFYAKQLLVPMGEFTPFSELFGTIFPDILGNISARDLTHGDKTVIFDTDQGSLNGIICYESIQPSIALDGTRKGSGLITMITNDSWFGKSRALTQHLSHAQLRAVENGRFLVRAGNSGITAVIQPNGYVTHTIPTYQPGYLNSSVDFIYSRTLYSIVGDIPFYLLLLFCMGAFIWDIIKQNKSQKCKI